jgi:hypothetical protein
VLKLAACRSAPADAIEDAIREVIGLDPDGVVDLYGWRDGADFWIDLPGITRFRFQPGSDAIVPVPEPGTDWPTVVDAYLGTGLPMAAQALLGYEALHASAVVTSVGVVAFCGVTEVGKSTFAYGLAARGYSQWGDDAVVLSSTAGQRPDSIQLPFAVSLRPASREYFGHAPSPRAVDLDRHEWRTAPLAAMFLPTPLPPDGSEPVMDVALIPASIAIREVLRHAFRFRPEAPGRRRQMIRSYLDLVARIPVFAVTYTRDFAAFEKLLDRVEEAVEASAPRS